MTLKKQIAVVAGMIEHLRRLEALITEAMQRMYASHVEKTQMRLVPVSSRAIERSLTEARRYWTETGMDLVCRSGSHDQ